MGFPRLIVPVVTPFREDYSVDIECLMSHVKSLIDRGVEAVYASSTVGELDRLDYDEILSIASRLVDMLDGGRRIYIGLKSEDPRYVVEYGDRLVDIGVSGLLILPPTYFKYGYEGLHRYYSYILSRLDIDIMIYSIPRLTSVDIPPDLFRDLASEYPNLVGAKLTTDDLGYIWRVLDTVSESDFRVYVGSDLLSLPAMVVGCYGLIPGLANIDPTPYIGLINSYLGGRMDEAIKMYRRIISMSRVYMLPAHPPAILKYILSVMGSCVGRYVRPPMEPIPDKYRGFIKNILNI